MQRHGLTDREWMRIRPLLPPRARIGRPPKDHRMVLDALLWLDRTGAPVETLSGPKEVVARGILRAIERVLVRP